MREDEDSKEPQQESPYMVGLYVMLCIIIIELGFIAYILYMAFEGFLGKNFIKAMVNKKLKRFP